MPDTTLTDTERADLAAWWESDWPSDGADVLDTLAAAIESIVAARVAAARAEERAKWVAAIGRRADDFHERSQEYSTTAAASRHYAWQEAANWLRALIEGADQ